MGRISKQHAISVKTDGTKKARTAEITIIKAKIRIKSTSITKTINGSTWFQKYYSESSRRSQKQGAYGRG
jgi:hypothetical protein